MKRTPNMIGSWLKKHFFRILTVILLLLLIWAVWFRGEKGDDSKKEKTLATQIVSNTIDVAVVLKTFMDIESTAGEIYDLYLYEGHAGSMNDPAKMQIYIDLYAISGDLLKSINDYRRFTDSYTKNEELVMREGVLVLAEKFCKILDENKSFEGYDVTKKQRERLSKYVSSLRPT